MSFLKNRLRKGSAADSVKDFVPKVAIQKGMMETEEEVTRKQELGSVYEFGHDESAELLQDMECFEPTQAYAVDEKGEVIKDGDGNPKIVVMDQIAHHNAAMRIHSSPRNQWRVLEQADIDIAGLAMRSAYLKRMASMTRDEYDAGKASFWQAVETSAKLNLCDSRKGNKFRIMNTRRSVVEYGEIQKQKKLGVF